MLQICFPNSLKLLQGPGGSRNPGFLFLLSAGSLLGDPFFFMGFGPYSLPDTSLGKSPQLSPTWCSLDTNTDLHVAPVSPTPCLWWPFAEERTTSLPSHYDVLSYCPGQSLEASSFSMNSVLTVSCFWPSNSHNPAASLVPQSRGRCSLTRFMKLATSLGVGREHS